MTSSEWHHVPPIWTNNEGLQETPPRAQFLSYDQLSSMIWRRISRAIKLLSRFFHILKIQKRTPKIYPFFFFSKITPLKTKNLEKPEFVLIDNGWWICVQNFKSISFKLTELWNLTCWKQPDFAISLDFPNFILWPIFVFSKGVLGSFFMFFANIWHKNMHCSAISRFFYIFLPDDLNSTQLNIYFWHGCIHTFYHSITS